MRCNSIKSKLSGIKSGLFLCCRNVLVFVRCSPDSVRRGLILDHQRGNLLKIDRNRYVRKAYHGSQRELTSAERKQTYSDTFHTFNEPNFVNIDTLFQLVDACLFMGIVDFVDQHPKVLKKTYDQIFFDIARAVSECHVDGTIKQAVMKNPDQYINYDEGLVPMLQRFRQAGKKVSTV
jgi:5'-nucleotidase